MPYRTFCQSFPTWRCYNCLFQKNSLSIIRNSINVWTLLSNQKKTIFNLALRWNGGIVSPLDSVNILALDKSAPIMAFQVVYMIISPLILLSGLTAPRLVEEACTAVSLASSDGNLAFGTSFSQFQKPVQITCEKVGKSFFALLCSYFKRWLW